jgi:hypothetical protein
MTANAGETPSPSASREEKAFALHIMNLKDSVGQLGYAQEKSWPILKAGFREATVLTLSVDDIETFEWSSQTITLSAAASHAFRETFKTRAPVAGDRLPNMYCAPFVVTTSGIPLYGGIFLDRMSAMGIRYPVIYLNEAKDGRLTLTVSPFQTARPLEESSDRWRSVKLPEIRDVFAKAGKLRP